MFRRLIIIVTAAIMLSISFGCVHNVNLVAVDPAGDISRAFPATKKIPAKVGVYLSNDLRTYVYQQQKMGMTFQMKVGEYVVPISQLLVGAMFQEVILVDSLPPYIGPNKPDVEAVVVPEIMYAYGNAVGTLSGYIETTIQFRARGYDLSGKLIWQDTVMGTKKSDHLNFASEFLGGMEGVGKVGYEAALAASIKIINNFNKTPPRELYSLVDIKRVEKMRNLHKISNFAIFKEYYQKGQKQFEKKNYFQSLYSFEKAEALNPDDLSTIFHLGVCNVYTNQKTKALDKFRQVVSLSPKSQEAKDSRTWINNLQESLKIGIIVKNISGFDNTDLASLYKAISQGGMFEIVEIKQGESEGFRKKLDLYNKEGVRIVLLLELDAASQKFEITGSKGGDIATEHAAKVTVKAYSAKKKTIHSEYVIRKTESTIQSRTDNEVLAIKRSLLKNAVNVLTMQMLAKNLI